MSARSVFCISLLLACSSPTGPCSPATCSGCCNELGKCAGGTEDGACGKNGTTCDSCSAARFCEDATCVVRCTAANCGGCCDELGVCNVGDQYTACGSAGSSCADCSLLGRLCIGGLCGGSAGGAGGGSGTGGGNLGGGAGGGSAGGGAGSSGSDGGPLGLTVMRVFTTSGTVLPNFGGVAIGDRICESVAADAGLGSGKYVAWLSTQDAGALSRFAPSLDVHWDLLAGGGTAFNNRSQLTRTPNVALNRDERGNVIMSGSSWTGTATGGNSSGTTCGNWGTGATTGTFGSVIDKVNWTAGGVPALCTTQRHLYCFQVQ